MNDYEARREARIERMRERAAKRNEEADAKWNKSRDIAAIIPMGQPILVGHHSERRHRRDIKRIDQNMRSSIEARKEAADLERRADAAEASTAVSSDDPEAIIKLRVKLAEEEHRASLIKRDVAAARKATKNKPQAEWPAALAAANVSHRFACSVMTCGFVPSVAGNASANVRRIKARIAELEAKATKPPTPPETYGDVRIEESDNRVRIFFPGKPDEATRTELKSHGFRWAPSEGAWQRHATHDAWYWARKIGGKG